MRIALILALSLGSISVAVAVPHVAHAAQKKPKKAALPATKPPKNSTKEFKLPKEKEPERSTEPKVTENPLGGAPGELRGPTRIDFDDRLIQGQTNKSGAVYLFDRKETGISSMVRRTKSFRKLTLATVYDR